MLPKTHHWRVYQGDTFSRWLRYSLNGTPVDLTGWQIASQIRAKEGSTTAVSFAVEVDPDIPGRFRIHLTPEQTNGLSGTMVWDLRLTDPQGNSYTYLRGQVQVTPRVTR
jgi:hypothetical protein